MAARHQLKGEHIYDGIVLSSAFPPHILSRVKEFQFFDNDVMIATYPKAGTTWFQEVVWLVMNNADTDTAIAINQDLRVPFLEIDKGKVPLDIDILERSDPPRLMKTHLPYRFFGQQLKTKKVKLILGARNIKDTLVSMYHFYRMNEDFGCMEGPFSEFFELFRDKHLAYGDWFDYNLDYWENRDSYSFFLLKYEDMHKNPKATIKRLAEFLEKELTEEQVDTIASFVRFDAMKVNDKVNKVKHPLFHHDISPFLRKGTVADWKNYLTEEQNEYVDKLCRERIEGTGLEFDFEI